jgi:hypothetical protein
MNVRVAGRNSDNCNPDFLKLGCSRSKQLAVRVVIALIRSIIEYFKKGNKNEKQNECYFSHIISFGLDDAFFLSETKGRMERTDENGGWDNST